MEGIVLHREMEEGHFQIQLRAVLDALMQTALSDICALTESWAQSLHAEIRRTRRENQDLKQRLYSSDEQENLPQTQTQTNPPQQENSTPTKAEETDFTLDKKMLDNSGNDSATSKRGQWCVMLQQLNPVLTGAKAEVMDRSISERKKENLEATYGDSLYTPVGLHAEVDNPFYDHKTESEKALPKATTLQSSEPCPDINDDCEDVFEEPAMEDEENETENHLQIPQPKREEEDEFDITLLSPDLQLNSTQLLRETQPESTLSDYTVPFKLDKDLSGTAPMVHHFYKRPLPNDKQIGGTFICDICGKSLTTKGSFICHLRVHSGERPFTCTQCGKRFAKKFNLHIHYNIHSGARPYACALCPKSFADPSALGRHKVTHNMAPGQTVQSKTSQWVKSKKHTAEKRYIVQKTSFRNLH